MWDCADNGWIGMGLGLGTRIVDRAVRDMLDILCIWAEKVW